MDTQPVPGFPVHTSILTEASYVPVEESTFVLKCSRPDGLTVPLALMTAGFGAAELTVARKSMAKAETM